MPRDNIISLAQHRASRAYMRAISEGPARAPARDAPPHSAPVLSSRLHADPFELLRKAGYRPTLFERVAAALDSPRFLGFYVGFYAGCLTTVGLAYVWSAL